MVMYFYLSKNAHIYFVDNIENIGNLMQEVRPTMMTTVPRLLEKIYGFVRFSAHTQAALLFSLTHYLFFQA